MPVLYGTITGLRFRHSAIHGGRAGMTLISSKEGLNYSVRPEFVEGLINHKACRERVSTGSKRTAVTIRPSINLQVLNSPADPDASAPCKLSDTHPCRLHYGSRRECP